MKWLFTCDSGGSRTLDPQIKSLLLYQLSYEATAKIEKSSNLKSRRGLIKKAGSIRIPACIK